MAEGDSPPPLAAPSDRTPPMHEQDRLMGDRGSTNSNGPSTIRAHGWTLRYISVLQRWRWLVLGCWVLLAFLATWQGPLFLQHTAARMPPERWTESAKGRRVVAGAFPEREGKEVLAVLIHTTDKSVILSPAVADFTRRLSAKALDFSPRWVVYDLEHYYTYNEQMPTIAEAFVSHTADANRTHMMLIFNLVTHKTQVPAFLTHLQKAAAQLAAVHLSPRRHAYMMLGDAVFRRDGAKATELDTAIVDQACFPLALLALCFALRSVRLLIIPIVSYGVSIGCAMLFMYPPSVHLDFPTWAPSLMMTLSLAMAVDSCLFLLSRYAEELRQGASSIEALCTMLESAGHTILVSNCTLMLCFAGWFFFPVALLRHTGFSVAVAIAMVLVVNLNMVPCVLLCFESFFVRAILATADGNPRLSVGCPAPAKDGMEEVPLRGARQRFSPRRARKQADGDLTGEPSLWYRLTESVMERRLFIIAGTCLLLLPFSRWVRMLEPSCATTFFVPRSSESSAAFAEVSKVFAVGRMFPVAVMVEPPPSLNIMSAEVFDAASAVIRSLISAPAASSNSFISIYWVPSLGPVPAVMAQLCLKMDSTRTSTQCREFHFLHSRYVNAEGTAVLIDVALDVDPYGLAGKQWLKHARTVLQSNRTLLRSGYRFALHVDDMNDIVEATYGAFPTTIAVTSTVVLLLFIVAFGSAVVALTALVTIGFTLVFVFGSAVWVYQLGGLDWLGWPPLQQSGGLVWMVPVMTFTIVVGLAVDYDVFLLVRVLEFRKLGYSDRDAILLAQERTGHVITTAGVVMAVSLGGLLFSSLPGMNQWSFVLGVSVLVDTFFVRTMLVPAVMGLLDRWNWWPLQFPPPSSHVHAVSPNALDAQ